MAKEGWPAGKGKGKERRYNVPRIRAIRLLKKQWSLDANNEPAGGRDEGARQRRKISPDNFTFECEGGGRAGAEKVERENEA